MRARRRLRRPTRVALALLGLASVPAACGGGANDAAVRDPAVPVPAQASVAETPSLPPTASTGVVPDRPVGVRTETYVDPTRPTSAVEGHAGAPDRTFPVTVWYPAIGAATDSTDAPPDRRGGPYPLVVFSHGYAVTPAFYEALLTRWAAAGYVVVAPTYPLLSGAPAGPSHADYDQVFADQRFLLDRVLEDLATPPGPHPLAGIVDPARVAVAGQSDGEVAAFGVGFLECCRDARVRAVVAMAGNLGNLNNPIVEPGIPVLHLIGELDELQPHVDAIAWDRQHLPAPRWIVTLVGGGHAAPYRDPADARFDPLVAITTAFLDGTLKGRADRLGTIDDVARERPELVRVER